MFVIETADGRRFTEDFCYWHDLPRDLVIARIGIKFTLVDTGAGVTMNVADDFVTGFDEYGFQKYEIVSQDPAIPRIAGAQIIGISRAARTFVTLDVNMSTGERLCAMRPLSEMTYKPELLRPGLAAA